MSWWHRKKHHPDHDLDEYVARERAEVESVYDDTRRQVEATRSLRAESSRVHERMKKIREQNHFTAWLNKALRGVQEDGR